MGDLRKDTNKYIVNSLNDFPVPVGGKIILPSDTTWDLNQNNINIFGVSLELNDRTVLRNGNIFTDSPIYFVGGITVTELELIGLFNVSVGGTVFIATDFSSAVIRFTRSTVIAGNATIFDMTTTSPQGIIQLDSFACIAAVSMGTFTGMTMVIDQVQIVNVAQGFSFVNNYGGITVTTLIIFQGLNSVGTRWLDISGICNSISIIGFNCQPKSNEKVYYFNPALVYGGINVNSSPVSLTESGVSTANIFDTGSLDKTSPRVKFVGCANIPDSTQRGNLFFQESTTETTIDQTEVPIKINATYNTGDVERFTGNSSLTYIGSENNITLNAVCTLTLKPVTGTNILLGAYITKTEAETIEVTFTNATNIVNLVAHGLSNGTSIRFSNSGGALPAEIRDDQFYFVVNAATDTFQIENLVGDGVHAFTDDGTGTHYYSLGEYIDSSEANATPSSGRQFSITTQAAVTLTTGDIIEVFIDNHDTTSNVIVENLQLIVS